jgi:hypothetical protein
VVKAEDSWPRGPGFKPPLWRPFFRHHSFWSNGRVDFEEWSAYKIQLHGIEWIVSLSADWDQSPTKKRKKKEGLRKGKERERVRWKDKQNEDTVGKPLALVVLFKVLLVSQSKLIQKYNELLKLNIFHPVAVFIINNTKSNKTNLNFYIDWA